MSIIINISKAITIKYFVYISNKLFLIENIDNNIEFELY